MKSVLKPLLFLLIDFPDCRVFVCSIVNQYVFTQFSCVYTLVFGCIPSHRDNVFTVGKQMVG